MAEITRVIGEGITVKAVVGDSTDTKSVATQMIVTAVYDYMESDPIYRITAIPSDGDDPHNPNLGNTPEIEFTLTVDSDTVDRRITAFNVYVANSLEELEDYSDWLISYSEFFLAKTVDTDSGWTGATASKEITFTLVGVGDVNKINLLDSLGRAPSFSRERVEPRYIVQSRRSQGSLVVIDEDDQTLRLSTYSGYGVHEDENFPNVSTDNLGNPQIIRLNARGTLMGIEILNEQILAFKQAELEVYDLQSGATRLLTADCIASKSILRTPFGVVWAGRSAIYLLPNDGSGIQVLNPNWKNLYDGTYDGEAIAGGDIIAGYDPIEQAAWFTVQDKVYRYSFKYNVWNLREFNLDDEELPVESSDVEEPIESSDVEEST